MLLVASISLTVAVPGAFGQASPSAAGASPQPSSTSAKALAWDVVSIRPSKSCTKGSGMMPTADEMQIFCLTPQAIIKLAYGVWGDDQILGATAWTTTTSYDIEAKVDAADVVAFTNRTFDQHNLMLQTLLRDRFMLKVHLETRDLPIYALVVAKSGPRLNEAKANLPGSDAQPMMRMKRDGETLEILATGMHVQSLAPFLLREVGRTVVDKTGLKGTYDFTLQFTPQQSTATDSTAPSIFTAIQEQLGLKLESQKAPMEVIVIDHIEKPSEN
jgi:uncharacterized protein (TIGR03435 family)